MYESWKLFGSLEMKLTMNFCLDLLWCRVELNFFDARFGEEIVRARTACSVGAGFDGLWRC